MDEEDKDIVEEVGAEIVGNTNGDLIVKYVSTDQLREASKLLDKRKN